MAVRQRVLAYNPATAVELPDVDTDKADPLTIEEARALLEATREDRLHPLWRLAIVTGLRLGELLGLAWEDVDVGSSDALSRRGSDGVPESGLLSSRALAGSNVSATPASVTVRAQLQRLDGQWVRTPPKAARKVERVTIDADTAAVLEEHRRRMAEERRPDDAYFGLVFLTTTGNPMHQSEALKAFKGACRKAGIRERRFHDLRHTAATLMREGGVAEETRMARLGHSTQAMSRKYSEHGTEAQDRLAAEALGKALGGAG